MTTRNTTPPAPRQFRVYATHALFQTVEAASAEEAYRLAGDAPHSFEPCGSRLALDRDVKDVGADEYVRVGPPAAPCKTCGSEIVATVNGSNFGEGECGPCEYRRYRTQPDLLKSIVPLLGQAEDMLCELYDTDDPTEWPWVVAARTAVANSNMGFGRRKKSRSSCPKAP